VEMGLPSKVVPGSRLKALAASPSPSYISIDAKDAIGVSTLAIFLSTSAKLERLNSHQSSYGQGPISLSFCSEPQALYKHVTI
jgi:hypothetical protein